MESLSREDRNTLIGIIVFFVIINALSYWVGYDARGRGYLTECDEHRAWMIEQGNAYYDTQTGEFKIKERE